MKNRPRNFSIISIILILMPVFTILTTVFIHGIPLYNSAELLTLLSMNPYEWIYFLSPIIAGMSLLTMKSWSFYSFVISLIILAFAPLLGSQNIPNFIVKNMTFGVYLAAIYAIVTLFYFSLKKNRLFFFHPSRRWWERAVRYHAPLTMSVKSEEHSYVVDTTILNLSTSGLFFAINSSKTHEFQVGENFRGSISFQDIELSIPIKIIRSGLFEEKIGHGAKFDTLEISSRLGIRKLVNHIKLHQAEYLRHTAKKTP